MPLPEGFSPSEHLQDVIKNVYNRAVRVYFRDLGGDDWSPNIDTGRASLRLACQHDDADSFAMTIGRMMLFDLAINQKTSGAMGLESTGSGVYRKHKPQIVLWFQEDNEDVEFGYSPVKGRISFRLMSYTEDTISTPIAITIANKIKQEFAAANGYIWQKGKTMYSYSDWDLGYQFQLLCRTESGAIELINKLLDIQGDSFQPEYLNISQNHAPAAAYPTIPPTKVILGESRKLARNRPIADVRFQYALLVLKSLPNPICLYDRSGTYAEPLIPV